MHSGQLWRVFLLYPHQNLCVEMSVNNETFSAALVAASLKQTHCSDNYKKLATQLSPYINKHNMYRQWQIFQWYFVTIIKCHTTIFSYLEIQICRQRDKWKIIHNKKVYKIVWKRQKNENYYVGKTKKWEIMEICWNPFRTHFLNLDVSAERADTPFNLLLLFIIWSFTFPF